MKEKDKELFLVSVLKIFVIMFIGSFFIRIIGFDKFGLDLTNPTVKKITDFIYKGYIVQFISLYFSCFVMMKLICTNKKEKRYYVVTFFITLLNILIQILLNNPNINNIYAIISTGILVLGVFVIEKRVPVKRTIVVFLLGMIYQGIAAVIRNISYQVEYTEVYDFLLQIDYIILLSISYIIVKMKGSEYLWSLRVVGSSLHLQHSSKKSAKKLPKQSLSREEKVERLTENIYLGLVILWNLFTLACVIMVCTLNTTIITTLFLIVAFMITKTTFGEAFHMKSALSCFFVSNLVYFALSRITVSIHISFIVPIILGVALSYVTSLFVRKKSLELYRGISEDNLKAICKNSSLNQYEENLLIDFYCKKMSLVKLARKYNYSKDTIYYHKKRAIEKIREVS